MKTRPNASTAQATTPRHLAAASGSCSSMRDAYNRTLSAAEQKQLQVDRRFAEVSS
jgi:hypothetical protein